MELFNKQLSLEELEVLRRNFGVRLSDGGNFIGLDDYCELLNKSLKQLPDSNDIESLKAKATILPLFNLCRNYQSSYRRLKEPSASDSSSDHQPKRTTRGKSISPSRNREKKAIFRLFSYVHPFGYEGDVRKVDDDIVWRYVPTVQAYIQELIAKDKKQSDFTRSNNENNPTISEDDTDSEEEENTEPIEHGQEEDEMSCDTDSEEEANMDSRKESNTTGSLYTAHYSIFRPKLYESKNLKEEGLAMLGSTKDLEKTRKKEEDEGNQRRLMVEEARNLAKISATKRIQLLGDLGVSSSPEIANDLQWRQCYRMMGRPFECTQLKNLIATMANSVWGISKLREGFQDKAVFDIVDLRYQSQLIVQKTGGGKSAIFQCAGTILGINGGVTVVVEPVHMVACDQVERANRPDKSVVAVYIDMLSNDEVKMFDDWLFKKEKKESIFVFTSPQSLDPEHKFGGTLIKRLCHHKLLRLVVIDEAHMVSTTDKSFRPHFANMKQNLFCYAKQYKVPVVAMTATMTHNLLQSFYDLSGIKEFESVLWGDVSRRDVEIICCTKSVPTHYMKATVGKHLKVNKQSRAIIYSNEKHYAMVNAKNAISKVFEKKNIAEYIFSVHGDTALTLKQWAAKNFCNNMGNDATSFPIRVLTATESAECGIDSPDCSLCICIGPPPSLASLSQRLGRVGRNQTRKSGDNFVIILSVPTFNFLVRRAEKHLSKDERDRHMNEMLQVMRFLIIQEECMHVKLEKIFSEPGTFDARDCHPCATMCSFCRKTNLLHPISRTNLIHTLNALFVNGATSPEQAVDAIFSAKGYIWSHLTDVQKKDIKVETVHTILLQLIATQILEYDVDIDNNDRSDDSNIHVKIGWRRIKTQDSPISIPAYKNIENWKGINIYEQRVSAVERVDDSDITHERMHKRQRCTSDSDINMSE